jgi:hypothetical protein
MRGAARDVKKERRSGEWIESHGNAVNDVGDECVELAHDPPHAPRCRRVAMILNMSAGEHKHDDARASRCESFCAFDPS